MIDYLNKHWRKITNISLFAASLVILFYSIKFSFIYAAPIYFALLFYAIYKPCINFLHKKGISYKLSVSISITSITLFVIGLITSIGTLLFFQGQNILNNLPNWLSWAESAIQEQVHNIKSQLNQIPEPVSENAQEQFDSFTDNIVGWVTGITGTFFANVSLITKIIIQIVLGYILSIFLAFEWPTLKKFLSKHIPISVKSFTVSVFGDAIKGLGSFIKAQAILISCTFLIIWVSLSLLGVNNALFLAFLSALFDMLPLVGLLTLFLPWVIYLFIVGEVSLAIKLSILWAVVAGFRQVMEPKITGNSLGISPFFMLSGMFVMTAILGFVGLILTPVVLVIIKSLWEKGYFQTWFVGQPKEEIKTTN